LAREDVDLVVYAVASRRTAVPRLAAAPGWVKVLVGPINAVPDHSAKPSQWQSSKSL